MTQEEKAKAYDEVVARINKAVSDGCVSENFGRDMLGIAESEDERIRKAIKCYVEDMPDTYGFAHGIGKKEMLSYLEKQKERTMPNSTELIEMWDKEKAILEEKDFRGDEWRLAYNAFLDGFARGCSVKQKERKDNSDAPLSEIVQKYIDDLKERHFSVATWDLVEAAVCYGYFLARQASGTTKDNSINPFDTKLFQDGVKEGRRLEREDVQKERRTIGYETR